MRIWPAHSVLAVFLTGITMAIGGDEPTPEQAEFFESKVRPVLADHCFRCHSNQSDKLKGELFVDSLPGLLKGGASGPAVIAGSPEQSPLIHAIRYQDPDIAMPPKQRLAENEIAALTKWVEMGAPWPGNHAEAAAPTPQAAYNWPKFRQHWSFRPVVKPAPPAVRDETWGKSTIDRFVLANLEANGLKPNPRADKRTLIRRAYLDLIGLPPTPAQVSAFLADENPDAFAKVVNELLDSQQYGERWARHWLDVARYSDGLGGFLDSDELPQAWRYRDWVIDALNADLPYDQFVIQQIAGSPEDPTGTGFFAVGPTYRSDGGDPEAIAQAQAETLADRVDTFSRAFLALTVACARCHDHKFDPIPTLDYYAIAGVFNNTTIGEHPLAPEAEVRAYQQAQKAIKEQTNAINQFLAPHAKRLGVNAKVAERKLEGSDKAELDVLREKLQALEKASPSKFEFSHTLAESGRQNMHVALRGDLRKPGEIAPRRFLKIVAGDNAAPFSNSDSGRLDLAKAVADPENPLTARVIVNRVWQWHFGDGLVRTPSNFGILGEKPTHPELLDWLAATFVEKGWSLKQLHREILLSATWQMSTAFHPENFAKDGDNRLLWRMNPRKLEVEAWRDSLLAVTGELDAKMGGEPVDGILGSKRRTLYSTVSRNGDRSEADEFLRLFDFPAPRSTAEARSVSTVPQQYLFMLNSRFVVARAETLSHTLHQDAENDEARIHLAYERLYSRPPTDREVELGLEWLGPESANLKWPRYAQVLLSAHEMIQMP